MLVRAAMERHEKQCFHNPGRTCRGCEFHGDMNDHSIPAMIEALRESGIDAARAIAEGCPACICSALIQARKQAKGDEDMERHLWGLQFEYKAEMDQFCNAVRQSRPEDFFI